MARGELQAPRDAAERSHAAWIAAVVILLFAVVHATRGGPHAPIAAAARAVWAAALLATALAVRRTGRRATDVVMVAAALVSVAALGVVSWAERGEPTFAYLLCAPLFVAVLIPDRARTVALAGVASVGAVLAVSAAWGDGAALTAELAVRAAAAGAFALLGCRVHARLVDAAAAEADARARAVAALEESERRRVRVEALAETGSRAALLAHDMAGPLAVVRANLEFLEDALARAPAPDGLAEARDALADARVCVDRLGADVAALRAAGQRGLGGSPGPAEPAPPSAPPAEGQGPGPRRE